jgi:hypothetical protein
MPRGGVKCPDCGYRFKTRRELPDGTKVSDLVLAESVIKGVAPDQQVFAYRCLGNGSKGKHPPQLVKIQRTNLVNERIVNVKIISKSTEDMLEEFTDAWREANKRKYRPDLVFKVT